MLLSKLRSYTDPTAGNYASKERLLLRMAYNDFQKRIYWKYEKEII
jgi:hypothetical protein